ncbi:MAG: L,D-transpeptidase family protein [Rhizobiaceae bacterium]
MPRTRIAATGLAALIAVGIVGAGTQAASSATLFEALFGQKPPRRASEPVPPPPPPPVQKKVAPVKISSPTTYTYRPEPVRPMDFSALGQQARNVAFEPGQAGGFATDLAGLDGYVLPVETPVSKAIADWYQAHPDYLWVKDGAPTERARQAIRVLGDAARYGLNPGDYSVDIPAGNGALTGAIRFEVALSARLLRYVRDVTLGRVDPNKLSGYHDLPAKPLNLLGVMTSLAATHDIRAYLESRHPAMQEYRLLVAELELLKAAQDDAIVVNLTGVLKPGQTNAELPKIVELIRRKGDPAFLQDFGPVLDAHGAGEVYDPALVDAVKAAQKAAGLSPDGVIGPRTVNALAGESKADRIAKVEAALETLRWLPRDFEARRVFINQASFMAQYFENDEEKLAMRVVVGKPSNQTSFFYDEIERVEFHPYWGVPSSILVNEMLPRLRRDPGYLDRAGYEVVDAKGKRVPSSSVNWGAYGAKIPFGVRQTPGEANALGELKILFPNKHAIYMHDTPSRDLFKRDTRAFSHGCVRLERPRDMAAAVLGWNGDQVAAALKKGHSGVAVPERIPVYLTYFTAWPEASGAIGYHADIYKRDAHLRESLQRVESERGGQG